MDLRRFGSLPLQPSSLRNMRACNSNAEITSNYSHRALPICRAIRSFTSAECGAVETLNGFVCAARASSGAAGRAMRPCVRGRCAVRASSGAAGWAMRPCVRGRCAARPTCPHMHTEWKDFLLFRDRCSCLLHFVLSRGECLLHCLVARCYAAE
jgi:hypothetical protein